MKRLLLAVLVLAAPATALADKLDRLSTVERQHYDALRVWMDAKEQKTFLKLKTTEARDQWLKDHGYWTRYYQYDKERRDAIAAGEVAVGWTQDQVYMAWGAPALKQRLARQGAERSEAFIYYFEVTPEHRALVWVPGSKQSHGAIDRFRYQVIVDDGVVAEVVRKKGWEDGGS